MDVTSHAPCAHMGFGVHRNSYRVESDVGTHWVLIKVHVQSAVRSVCAILKDNTIVRQNFSSDLSYVVP